MAIVECALCGEFTGSGAALDYSYGVVWICIDCVEEYDEDPDAIREALNG